jgi:hypothetical protein
VDRLNGAFDFMSHTVDVRAPRQSEGRYNIRNIGFFLWRLRSYPMENVVARQAALPWQYYFSPLGNPAPLFARLRREGGQDHDVLHLLPRHSGLQGVPRGRVDRSFVA